ncbi:ATP-binding protein [Streptomyces glaucus]|uniref:ATP-binding protein n=1 Tax=Streptomyces glaucus TaxID=284029 RepID=UPI003CD0B92C
MAPPSLPQPLNRLPTVRQPARPAGAGQPARLRRAEPPARPEGTTRSPRPPGGEDTGRLPGPGGPDLLASGARPPRTAHVVGLPATPASVGPARRHVRGLLTAWGVPGDTCDNAVLILSELVTNALTHAAGDRVVLRLHTAGDRLRIEVEQQNRGPTLPELRQPGCDDQSGRGLLLVETLSSAWGTVDTPHGSGRTVWAELPAGPRGAEPAAPPAAGTRSPEPAGPPPAGPKPAGTSPALPPPTTPPTRPTPHSAEGPTPHAPTAHP